jgi:hypothetical protein
MEALNDNARFRGHCRFGIRFSERGVNRARRSSKAYFFFEAFFLAFFFAFAMLALQLSG